MISINRNPKIFYAVYLEFHYVDKNLIERSFTPEWTALY